LTVHFQREIDLLRACAAPPRVFHGLGHRIQTGFRLDPAGARAFVAAQEASVAGALADGLEEAIVLDRIPRAEARPSPVLAEQEPARRVL
jgi:hypothetical protein